MIIRRLALLFVLSASVTLAAQSSPLKIVVVEGEAGVNIIQQKTAVKPIVEVRDRNNQPVAGVIVTFSVEGGKAATFGGASTLTVATNAAGQAAVTSLTPNVAGAFQIQVSAAFQGQVATATIAQTNVMTAAQAAAASAATSGSGSAASGGGAGGGASGGAGGAAGGAGGGLSTTTIAVAGAAVAGGAVAATQVAGNKEEATSTTKSQPQAFNGPFSGTMSETVVSRNSGQACTITRAVSGNVRLELQINEPGNVVGNINVNGTATVTSTSCAAVNQTSPYGGGTTVSGTQASVRGSSTTASNGTGTSGEAITGTQTTAFDGSVNGNTATGTLKLEMKSTSSGGGGGPVDSAQTGTFNLTLTKS